MATKAGENTAKTTFLAILLLCCKVITKMGVKITKITKSKEDTNIMSIGASDILLLAIRSS